MTNFPHDIDLRNSAHLLFEIGSVMTTFFGALFLLGLLLTAVLVWQHVLVQPALILTALFALLTIDGVIVLFLSARTRR